MQFLVRLRHSQPSIEHCPRLVFGKQYVHSMDSVLLKDARPIARPANRPLDVESSGYEGFTNQSPCGQRETMRLIAADRTFPRTLGFGRHKALDRHNGLVV